MHVTCMATKTISIDLVAHRRLSQARRTPKESFSQVIHRAKWEPEAPVTGVKLLEMLRQSEKGDPQVIEALEAAQKDDQPPKDRWVE